MHSAGRSFRTPLNWFVAVSVTIIMGACAGPSRGLLVPIGKTATDGGRSITLLAVTTRAAAPEEPKGYMYSGEREVAGRVNYAVLTLSLPPGRKTGELPVDADHPDPDKHVTLVAARAVDRVGAEQFLASELGRRKTDQRKALVFTHGYNTQFDEAAMRFAQIVDDTGFRGVPVLFSWPSRGDTTAYGYDKESANYSRDAFEGVLTMIAREKKLTNIELFAHSMGNWLTMETLRSAVISGNKTLIDRLGTVVLAAPDVDMDVFQSQVDRLGGLQKRFVLFASNDDYALRISRRLAGGKFRAGETTDIAKFRELGVTAHDLTSIEGGVGKNHGKAFGDGSTINEIGVILGRNTLVEQRSSQGNPLASGVNAVGEVVTDVGRALSGRAVTPGMSTR